MRKFRDWRMRYGQANEHNRWMPRDHWLEDGEKQAIIGFYRQYPLEGYRRLAFMMLDRDVAAVSPSSVYRVLKGAGLLADRWARSSRKGRGFEQPLAPHTHWYIDFSYVNVGGPRRSTRPATVNWPPPGKRAAYGVSLRRCGHELS